MILRRVLGTSVIRMPLQIQQLWGFRTGIHTLSKLPKANTFPSRTEEHRGGNNLPSLDPGLSVIPASALHSDSIVRNSYGCYFQAYLLL